MKAMIIYAHPYEQSYNNSILKACIKVTEKAGHQLDVLDLYKEEYDPLMTSNDLYDKTFLLN